MPSAWQAWLLASVAAVAGLIALIETGSLQVPMPHPAEHNHFQAWPEASPWRGSLPQMPPFSLPLQQLAVRLLDGQLPNVETVAGDARSGRLLLADKHGTVHVAEPLSGDGGYALQRRPLAQLGPGRVLGAKLDADGNLIMCDVLRGLLRLNTSSGVVEVLSARVSDDGSPVFYANGVDVAANGSVLFTSSTDILPARSLDAGGSRDTGGTWALDLFRGVARGRLLVWHPHTRTTHVAADGLRYPDGVLVAADWSHALVVETNALRVLRIWLTGDRAGEREVLITSLPGLPAGLARASDGNLWLSLTAPVPPYTRFLWPICLRAAIAWIPRSWRPPVRTWGAVLKVTPDSGQVLQVLLDPMGERVATASAATEIGGRLFLGNLMSGSYISVVDLQQLAAVELQQAAGGSTRGIDWSAVGGSSLHEQRELWAAE